MKVIVVTGAAGGIGLEIVRTFAKQKWRVVAIDRKKSDAWDSSVIFRQCDLADANAVMQLAQNITDDIGSVDVLINCAAAQYIGAVKVLSDAAWDETFAVNVRAPWLLMQQLHGALSQAAQLHGDATVININSIHSRVTSSGMVAYAASKGALSSLTRSAGIEYAKDGIRVNGIIPGAVATPMLTAHLTKAQVDKVLSRQLIHKLIEPSAIVGAIEYLISPAAANITGQELVIDSGVLPQLATEIA